jgi:O-methyltransferase
VILGAAARFLDRHDLEIVRRHTPDLSLREIGKDWPEEADTMIGIRRLDNIHRCVADVLNNEIPGDLIETGVWRGGGSIFMKAVLHAYDDSTRTVWVADSFEGLPKPNAQTYPADAGDSHWEASHTLAVSLEAVQANFQRYGLLDERVRFLKGGFKDTLPGAPIQQFAVARLDGDMYESTIQALDALYTKISPGGYLIVDDYALAGCKAAVDDFRQTHGIKVPIQQADWTGIYWKKP